MASPMGKDKKQSRDEDMPASSSSPEKKAKHDFNFEDFIAIMDSFKTDMMSQFKDVSAQLTQQQVWKQEVQETMSHLKSEIHEVRQGQQTAQNIAQEALSLATSLKEELNKMSRPASEASTRDPPTPRPHLEPLHSRLRQASFTTPTSGPTRGPPPSASSASSASRAPEDDGKTVLIGGLPKLPRDQMQELLSTHLGRLPNVHDVKPRHPEGTTGWIHFENSIKMWDFMRNKPNINLSTGEKPWFTIPKSFEERVRSSTISRMKKAILEACEQKNPNNKPNLEVIWGLGMIRINSIVVARLKTGDDAHMELSPSQLTLASAPVGVDEIMNKYKVLTKNTPMGAHLVSDWSS